MKELDVSRALAAAKGIARRCDLPVHDVAILQRSNKLSLRLVPCDAFARVAHVGQEVAKLEIEVAEGLAGIEGCPVAALDPRVAPRVHEQDGFAVTLWTWYEPRTNRALPPADYALALQRLHDGMRRLAVAAPHFTDRVAEAQRLVSSPDLTPALAAADRELLGRMLRSLRDSICDRGAPEQLLHGEPHSGNVLTTDDGPRFVDLETCCRGPVEFDLAHVPEAVGDFYPDVDRALLRECRTLVLAMVAAWRWDAGDEFPNGRRAGNALLAALRAGPPWPVLDDVMPE